MVPDDLHKATGQYSELQQQEAEEESLNEGFDSILLLMIMFLIQH